MSEFVEVEWFGREEKVGIVLTYDEHDGFKARMAPLPAVINNLPDKFRSEEADAKWLMENAAKIPFLWAWGIFGPRMKSEWRRRHLADKSWPTVRYDHRDYPVKDFNEGLVRALGVVDRIIDLCDDNRVTEKATIKAAAQIEREGIMNS